jgi:excisionase family DNA binding protein
MYRHVLGRWWDAHRDGHDHPMVDRRNTTRRELNRLAHRLRQVNGEIGSEEIVASGDRRFSVGDRITARTPNRHLHPDGNRKGYVRNGTLGTVIEIRPDQTDQTDQQRDTLVVAFDGIGTIEVPRSFFDHHGTAGGRSEVGIDHAYALTSYAVQGSTHDVSTSRIDPTTTRAETYVDITRGRHANHLYLTDTTDPIADETLPRVPATPADQAVAHRLEHSTGELTPGNSPTLSTRRPSSGVAQSNCDAMDGTAQRPSRGNPRVRFWRPLMPEVVLNTTEIRNNEEAARLTSISTTPPSGIRRFGERGLACSRLGPQSNCGWIAAICRPPSPPPVPMTDMGTSRITPHLAGLNDPDAKRIPSRQTFTVDEAAEILGISRSTAYECIKDGSLPALRFRRRLVVTRAAINALLGTAPPSV